MILAIETSCDDTCAAVITADGVVCSNVISSQQVHDRFGGVVPEVASRHHLELINLVIERALQDARAELGQIELVAATQGPGLIGALLVGLSSAKALAAARRLPFAAVDHLHGHVAANYLTGPGIADEPFEPPFLCLIASGGHTLLADVRSHERFTTLGRTLDDAAGEAFDKGARMLGLGFPGGPALQRLAQDGDPTAYAFPGSRAHPRTGRPSPMNEGLDFSFAGLKTALLYQLRDLQPAEVERRRADLAASYQQAIVDSLLARVERALDAGAFDRLAVGGGVAANGPLRSRLELLGVQLRLPPHVLCTDNAAMIASAARFVQAISYPDYLDLDAYASGERAA